MSVWKCPVCGSFMQHRGKSWSCAQGHNFDMAKSGYVNLLPVNRKHAKNPGDNAVMMRARKNFLDAGHYALLLQALEQAAVRYGRAGGVLLDAGCGEGYYTEGVSKALAQADLQMETYGVDISKSAADAAAKRCPNAHFAVGSVYHLPVADRCCDMLMTIFAPYCGEEYHRVLHKGGTMLMVIPGQQHLWGLKEAIYDVPYPHAVRQELLPLLDSRIEKIHQPTREELLVAFRGRTGGAKVLFSCAADRARVHLTQVAVENPKAPPMFCMLLRKRLGNGKLLAIRQDGLERVLYFDFSCVNELGDIVQLTLAIEIMGRYSNLILIDETGKVIDSMKRVDATMSSKRLVLPGLPYEMPPRDERLNFLQAAPEQMLAVLSTKTGELSKALLQTFEGVSPVLVREWAYYTGKGQPCRAESLTDDQKDRLCYTIGRTREILEQGEAVYTIVSTREGQPKDFSFLPLHQYGTLMVTKVMPSACALLDEFFASRDHMARLKQRANDLFHLLLHATERIQRRIVSQSEELEACGEKDTDRRKADLISANLYRLHKGDTEAVLEDFYEPDCPTVHIALDARLTPPQNAQKYYQAYKKACTAEKILTEQIAKGREELTYLDSVLDALSRAETENDLEQLRAELAEQGYLRLLRRKGKPPKSLPPMEFTASDGTRILVGRNNRQNDQLTLKTANKNDIWLHTQNIPGSHVILETGGREPSQQVLEEAAQLAAYHSKARDSAQVPVDYCAVRYVKKPAGAKPGMVIFTNQHTLYVKPEQR